MEGRTDANAPTSGALTGPEPIDPALQRRPTTPRAGNPLIHVLMCILPIYLAVVAIAIMMPLGSGPDESSHDLHAAGVVRGQLSGVHPRVPTGIAWTETGACWVRNPDVTPTCQSPVRHAYRLTAKGRAYTGNYFPLFYGVTGLATLVTADRYVVALYGTRLLAGLVASVLLGWALSLVIRHRRTGWGVTVMAIVITPMTIYLSAMLNPSSWEICATIAMVVAGWLVLHAPESPPRRLTEPQALLAIAGVLMASLRPISPEYALMILTGLALAAGWSRVRTALRSPATIVALSVIALSGMAGVVWSTMHPTQFTGVHPPTTLGGALGNIPDYFTRPHAFAAQLNQIVGTASFLREPSPWFTVALWFVLALGALTVAFKASNTWMRTLLGVGFVTVLVLPAVLQGVFMGPWGWQGRYTYPLIAALLLVAGLHLDRVAPHGPSRLIRIGVPPLMLVTQLALIAVCVHRYAVGMYHPWFPIHASWRPPGGWLILVAIVVVGLAWLAAILGMGSSEVADGRRANSQLSVPRR